MTIGVARSRGSDLPTSFSAGTVLCGVLCSLVVIGAAAGIGRLLAGLGATTTLTDGYPWGIWIGFDFALIAFSAVGFTMAAVVHVLHRHRFGPVLRPALLAGLLGYSAVLLLLVLDLGRPDRFYHFLLHWNMHSPLFEISWCVLLYTTVLLVEVSPDVFARLGWVRPVAWAKAIMAPVTILGVTLSTLHQSTLGTLYLNMPYRLDAHWYTPLLPLLFFVSSILAGLSLAVLAYRMACRVRGGAERGEIVEGLGRGMVGAAVVYLLLKLGDLAWAGELSVPRQGTQVALLLWLELGVCLLLPVLLWLAARRRFPIVTWLAPLLLLVGVGLNRFNATLFAQLAPPDAVYVPHILEWLSTLGILAGAILVWVLGVRFVLRPLQDGSHEG